MNSAIVFVFLSVVVMALARPDDKYTDRYDDVDVEQIINNPRLLGPYINCALDKGKCAPDAKELKSHIKEALENECAKCTDAQKKGTRRVISHLINKEPAAWKELCDKYDPDRKFAAKYEKELKDIQA